jgi:hypothetical protein
VSVVADTLGNATGPKCPDGGACKQGQSKPSRDTGTTASPNTALEPTPYSFRSVRREAA